MGPRNSLFKGISGKLPEDSLVENERGITLFGIPMFSSSLLMPHLDPTHWQIINVEDMKLKNIGEHSLLSRGELYPLAKSAHVGEKWFVLMDFGDTVDMDDQGWLYSWSFDSSRWKSKHGFVRRRIWVKKDDQMATGLSASCSPATRPASRTGGGSSQSVDGRTRLLTRLRRELVDRCRFELLNTSLEDKALTRGSLEDQEYVDRIAECFEFKTSKAKFLEVWLPHALKP